ncbi:MAG TPA: VOC family protein [Euzebyales bacterium]|nr:VOC family protein [Euzebyales bacterium]
MFRDPQVVLFSRDVEGLAAFYKELGFRETFRVPAHGQPIHIDVGLDNYVIGLASIDSTRDDHGLDPVGDGQRAAVVLWTDDTAAAYQKLVSRGCPSLKPPHRWLDRLLIAWVADPDDHPLQIVQRLPTT